MGRRIRYEEDIDYDDEVLSSPFTGSVCKELTKKITSTIGENLVISIIVTPSSMPVFVHLLTSDKVSFIFAHSNTGKCTRMIKAVSKLLKLDGKVQVTDMKFESEISDVTYIGIDTTPMKSRKVEAFAFITIVTERVKIRSTFSIEDGTNHKFVIPPVKMTISMKNEESIYNSQETLEEMLEQVTPLSGEDYTRPEPEEDEPVQLHHVKGDKYPNLRPPDRSKVKSKNPPKFGGFMEDSKFYVFGAELPSPDDDLDLESSKWRKGLKKFLKKLITLFYDNEDVIDQMLGDKYMDLWIQAWTHETYDFDTNYETLETVGDAALGYAFLSYLYDRDLEIDRAELTALKGNILSKASLRQVSWQLGMDKWLRMGGRSKSNTNTAEDLVEAFAAVLEMTSTSVITGRDVRTMRGEGIELVYKFISFLYNTVDITPAMYQGDAKTTLIQSLSGFDSDEKAIIEHYDTINNGNARSHVCSLSWSEDALKKLKKLGKNQDKLIVRVKQSSKSAAGIMAYREAIKVLKERKTPIKWFNDLKAKEKIMEFDPSLVKKVTRKLREEFGERTISFRHYTPKTLNTTTSVTVMLLGEEPPKAGKRKGKSHVLGILSGSEEAEELKVRLLENYVKYGSNKSAVQEEKKSSRKIVEEEDEEAPRKKIIKKIIKRDENENEKPKKKKKSEKESSEEERLKKKKKSKKDSDYEPVKKKKKSKKESSEDEKTSEDEEPIKKKKKPKKEASEDEEPVKKKKKPKKEASEDEEPVKKKKKSETLKKKKKVAIETTEEEE